MTRLFMGVMVFLAFSSGIASGAGYRQLPLEVYVDKMKGGWIGQMVGVVYGAPTEFQALGRIYEEDIPAWSADRIGEGLDQDDLYVELGFLQSIEEYGLDVTYEQAGRDFAETEFRLWHANLQGRENVRAGIMPPASGSPEHNSHYMDIDFQIQADLFGLINPGLPRSANEIGELFGRITNYSDGLYGGFFVAGMYAHAFFEDDVETVVRLGLRSIPTRSTYAQTIRDVLRWHKQYPDDWRAAWQEIQDKWASNPSGFCSRGNFNIDASLNGAYVVMGLLYGAGDLEKTIEIATRCGQDSDCNPSTAAGVLCMILGYENIPEEYTSGVPAIADKKFSEVKYSLNTLIPTCVDVARESIRRAGGRSEVIDGQEVFFIPRQLPSAPRLE